MLEPHYRPTATPTFYHKGHKERRASFKKLRASVIPPEFDYLPAALPVSLPPLPPHGLARSQAMLRLRGLDLPRVRAQRLARELVGWPQDVAQLLLLAREEGVVDTLLQYSSLA